MGDIPDYPDDYHPGNIPQNIEKTNENIRKYLKDDLNYLPVIQAKFPKQDSFLKNCKEVRALIGNYPRVAIGTVCKCEDLTFIRFCLQKARKYFPKTHIHAFGLTLKALPDALKFIDSFDSCAYTFPRGRGRGSCKTKVERVEFFHAYLNRIDEITTNEELKWKYQTTLS